MAIHPMNKQSQPIDTSLTQEKTGHRGRVSLGSLLCTLGWHKLDWRTVLGYDDSTGEKVVRDQSRCIRENCPQSHFWQTINAERMSW